MAKPGIGEKGGHQDAGEARDRLGETDLASDVMGNNQLQGDDQANVHNQRQAVPNTKLEADADPVESAKMLDKDVRARAELGKGNRHSPNDATNRDDEA